MWLTLTFASSLRVQPQSSNWCCTYDVVVCPIECCRTCTCVMWREERLLRAVGQVVQERADAGLAVNARAEQVGKPWVDMYSYARSSAVIFILICMS